MNRILVVVAGATLPAVVAVIGCAVDSDRYPGITNDVPNSANGSAPTTSTSSSSTSSSTSTSSSGFTGQVPSLCTCAAAFVMTGACADCAAKTIAADGGCNDLQVTCTNNNCTDATNCVIACAGDATCIAGCIDGNAAYNELLNCQCSTCLVECSVPTQPDCNLGGGGTGGAGPDAGGDAGDGG